jgi:hypothetical protein
MADWTTVASLATAGGTLVLAVATFSATRSANRAARTAERAYRANVRPVLFPARLDDPTEKIMWADRHFARVAGGHGLIEVEGDVVYLSATLRNVGQGIAVLESWHVRPGMHVGTEPPAPLSEFRHHSRDLYVPPGATGFWQGAIREPADPDRVPVLAALADDGQLTVDLLYGDIEGAQRTVSRFGFTRIAEADWLVNVSKHWYLDGTSTR